MVTGIPVAADRLPMSVNQEQELLACLNSCFLFLCPKRGSGFDRLSPNVG